MPSDWFRQHTFINETHAAILGVARTDPNRIANVVLMVEDSRKKGWCAFYESIRGQVRHWRREGVRRETLTTAHREVQNSTAGTVSAPPHFLKLIQLGFEAMISKWGPPNPELGAKIDALTALLPAMSANMDAPTLAAFNDSIKALEAQKPEQECELCMICQDPIEADQVFDEAEGVLFSPQCMHAMHDRCAQGYFNTPKPGSPSWGADGLPNQGKKIPCPMNCGGEYHRQYVIEFRRGRAMGREHKEEEAKKKAQEAERERKRKADALAAADASPDAEDALVHAPEDALAQAPEDVNGERPVPINERPDPAVVSPEAIQDWINRKVKAGHFRFLVARNKSGVPYQFVIDGTESTWPPRKVIKAVYPKFHHKEKGKGEFKLVDPQKPQKEHSAWGKQLHGGSADDAAGSV